MLGRGEAEGQLFGMLIRLGRGHALAADVHEAVGVAHHEWPHGQVEKAAVLERQVVRARDAHRAGLGVEIGAERRAQGVDATANTTLRLEHDRVVALALELERGHEAGNATADDQYALALTRAVVQPCPGHSQGVGGHRRLICRRRLARRICLGLLGSERFDLVGRRPGGLGVT